MTEMTSQKMSVAHGGSDPLAGYPLPIEVSVVLPCLNEISTLGTCIEKARAALKAGAVSSEIVVADNGSTDGSQALSIDLGARVVQITERGYGAAMIGGIGAAQGIYVIQSDADDSYDLSRIMPFIERLRGGDDLVVGNRFQGGIRPGAMPPLNRYVGNPVLSTLAGFLFGRSARDYHCGLRGMRRSAILAVGLQCPGMEFATEMIARAHMAGLRISELPVVLHKDGRARPSHLRPWRDGVRHLVAMWRLKTGALPLKQGTAAGQTL